MGCHPKREKPPDLHLGGLFNWWPVLISGFTTWAGEHSVSLSSRLVLVQALVTITSLAARHNLRISLRIHQTAAD